MRIQQVLKQVHHRKDNVALVIRGRWLSGHVVFLLLEGRFTQGFQKWCCPLYLLFDCLMWWVAAAPSLCV